MLENAHMSLKMYNGGVNDMSGICFSIFQLRKKWKKYKRTDEANVAKLDIRIWVMGRWRCIVQFSTSEDDCKFVYYKMKV